MTCPNCHAGDLPESAKFCVHCGTPLAAMQSAAASSLEAAEPADTASGLSGSLAGVPYRIVGYEMQAAVFRLGGGQAVLAEPGALLYMQGEVEMQTGTGGGFMAGMKRALAGDSFFLSSFGSATGGEAAFAAPYPGTIHPLPVGAREWLCQRHSFLCCSPNVAVSVAFTRKLGYGLFAGEGFILQKLSGQGDALVHAGGHFIRKQLRPGEQMRVDTGTVVAFDANIAYDIEFVKGFKNLLFGGEGLFFIVLTGPGEVILQTLSFDRLVSRIAAQATRTGGNAPAAVAGAGVLGGILGGVLGGGGNQGGSW
ncbi:MAG TPA: TIGR00266 family protein [Terriglobales bacterium]|nr:TIGR00266 family protein [Terriglobales bacterium]